MPVTPVPSASKKLLLAKRNDHEYQYRIVGFLSFAPGNGATSSFTAEMNRIKPTIMASPKKEVEGELYKSYFLNIKKSFITTRNSLKVESFC